MTNPYAPPETRQLDVGSPNTPAPGQILRREGPLLVVSKNARLPKRCVRCNTPVVTEMMTHTFRWHPAWIYLVLLASPVVYVIVAVLVRQRAVVTWGLCREHAAQRRNQTLVAGSLAALGVALFVAAGYFHDGSWVLAGLASLLAAIIWAVMGTRVLVPVEIDYHQVRFKGCGPAFLAGLQRP